MWVFAQFTLREEVLGDFEKRHFMARFGRQADDQTSRLDIS